MPPADDQQNVNPFVAPQQNDPQATPPVADNGQMSQQPTVFSPTENQSTDMGAPASAAPGFGSMPDSGPASVVTSAAPVSPAFGAPSVPPADVPTPPAAGDFSPTTSTSGDVPPVAPGIEQGAGSQPPVFPPSNNE